MATPCYLSLSSDGGVLTNMEDIIPSVLRSVFGQPGNTSDYLEQYKTSFRMLDAQSGTVPEDMCSNVSIALKNIYDRYFPNNDIIVRCEPEILTEARYNIHISVMATDINGNLVNLISRRKIEVNKETHEFKINFGNDANASIRLTE